MKHLKRFKKQVGLLCFCLFLFQSLMPLVTVAYSSDQASTPKTSQIQLPSSKPANTIIDLNLNMLIKKMVDDAVTAKVHNGISESLKCCYRTLMQGTQALPIVDVWQALPEILQYAVGQHSTKAARPDASKLTTNSSMVAPGACDLTYILELLVTIKNRIGCVSGDVCCKTILGILGDACEKFGPDSNISCKLLEICETLLDLGGQVDECCTEILEEMSNLSDQFDECCTEIREDINDVGDQLEECCTEIQEGLDDLGDQLDECCEIIRQDIFDTQTIICEKLENLNVEVNLLDCDFIIRQTDPDDNPRVHKIIDPITVPGVYCLAEDVTGTLVIDSDNVVIRFNNHTLLTSSPGVIINNHEGIGIEGGTIRPSGFANTAIIVNNVVDIKIINMNFVGNELGIQLDGVKDFVVHDCRFTNYTNSNMKISNSSNGKITCCQMHDNAQVDNVTLITTVSCKQLHFEDIVMTENIGTNTFTGINIFFTHESRFDNIQITCNEAEQIMQGIRLENSNSNSISECTINKNIVSSDNIITTFVGIEIIASLDGGSKHNTIFGCQIHENLSSTTGTATSAFFAGIHIASTINDGTVSDNACSNTIIDACSVGSNVCFSNDEDSYFMGINLAGAIETGTIHANACANSAVINCTITNNRSESQAAVQCTFFTGINLAGIQRRFLGGNPVINVDACKNCHIKVCNVSDNICTSSAFDNFSFFVGINLSGIVGFGGSIDANCCANCSINNCHVGNNSCSSSGIGDAFLIGINAAGTIEGGTVEANACACCSIRNCTINKNSCLGDLDSSLIGINLSDIVDTGTVKGGGCNDCYLDTISICQDTLVSFTVGQDEDDRSSLIGIAMNGRPGTGLNATHGGCNNITGSNIFIGNNVVQNQGTFFGFYIDGTGAVDLIGGCNNISLKNCAVERNAGIGDSEGYRIIGTGNEGTGGARNIQVEGCIAKQNSSTNSMLDGFDALDITNAIFKQCMAIANTTHGFRLQNVIDSCLRECKVLDNGQDGFAFEDATQHLTIVDSQALGNDEDGFNFATTTTQCHIRNSIAQDNTGVGFNNEDNDEKKHQFFGNFAQGNASDNYFGVDLVTAPNLITGSFANIET